jgi:hypothetical protein
MVYELHEMPMLNPLKLKEEEKERIKDATSKLLQEQRKHQGKIKDECKKELDIAVFDVLGLSEDERRQVYEGLESLRRMRLQRKEVEVLVETAEKWKPVRKPKKERIKPVEPSKRLDTWIKQ